MIHCNFNAIIFTIAHRRVTIISHITKNITVTAHFVCNRPNCKNFPRWTPAIECCFAVLNIISSVPQSAETHLVYHHVAKGKFYEYWHLRPNF